MPDIVERSVARAIDYIEKHPGVTYSFNTKSIVQATNAAGKELDKVIEGGEGHSGASWHAAFWTLVQTAKDRGYNVTDDEAGGVCSLSFAAAVQPAPVLPPDVSTAVDIAVMRPLHYKQKS